MTDDANFIALIEAHEKLLGLIKATSVLYFSEAICLNGQQPERVNKIGDALDDLHLPIANNIKRLRTLVNADPDKGSASPQASVTG